jgi:ribosomal protein S18 acetylase RimI-like enzyme
VIFRDATLDDVPTVVALVESAYRGDASRAGWTTEADLLDGQRTDADAVADVITAAASRLLLAVGDDGVPLACCQLEQRRDRVSYFGMFAVAPGHQGGGVGRAMLAEAERIAREEWAAATMRMTVIRQRGDLIAWYERRGYTAIDEFEPFPYGDERFGKPRRDDLEFQVLTKPLEGAPAAH